MGGRTNCAKLALYALCAAEVAADEAREVARGWAALQEALTGKERFAGVQEGGLHTCLDTSLYAPPAAIEAMLPVTDFWLPDYKADDDALHVKYTGVSNKVVRKNLERLVAANAKMEVRMLVVPGGTDGADVQARHAYLRSLGIPDESVVELEYLDYARSKYLALGMPDTMPAKRLNHNSDNG